MKSIKEAVVNLATDLSPIRQQISAHPPKAYGRVPLSANTDKRLNGTDIRVYAGIAYFVLQGNVCRESYAEIAAASGVTRQQVARAVKHLIKFGHITPSKSNHQRMAGWLILPSPVFGQKQRALDSGESIVEDLVSRPRRRLATARTA